MFRKLKKVECFPIRPKGVYLQRKNAFEEGRRRKIGGIRYEARSRGRSSPDTLAF